MRKQKKKFREWDIAASVFCLLACWSSGVSANPPDAALARFAVLARRVAAKPVAEKPTAEMSEALDILLQAAWQKCRANPNLTDEQLATQLKPFQQKLDPDKKTMGAMDARWFAVSTARRENLLAIAVTFGAASRLRVHDTQTGKTVAVPSRFDWFYPFQPLPYFADDGTLLLVSGTVRDMGFRSGLRLDALQQNGQRFGLKQTILRQVILDNAQPDVKNNRIVVKSVDEPQAFFFAQADDRLGRTEVFEVKNGTLTKIRDEKHDRALRAVDAWIMVAKRVQKPSKEQSQVRRYLPQLDMVEECVVKRLMPATEQATLTFDDVTFRFVIQHENGANRVISLQIIPRKR